MNAVVAPADFLSRVALPSLGALPLVRPRMPSLFEERRGEEGAIDEGELARSDEAPPWRPPVPLSEQRPNPLAARAQVERRDVALPEVKAFAPEQQDFVVQQGRPAAAPPPSPAPALPAVRVPDRREHSGELPHRPERPPEAALRRIEPVAVPAPPARPARLRGQDTATVRVQAVTHRETETVVRVEPAHCAPPSAPIATITMPVAMPKVNPAPLPPSRRNNAMTVQALLAPPAITITIGRIDIRAAASLPVAPTPSTRAPQSQPQSLDDYLKQRTGGS